MKNILFIVIFTGNFLFGLHVFGTPDKPDPIYFYYDSKGFTIGLKKEIHIIHEIDRGGDPTAESLKTLDTLVYFLQVYTYLTIEVSSHTDTRGNSKYNRELSKRRAMSIVDYLVSKGIESQRLTYRGAGDDELKISDEYIKENAKTKPEKELLHQQNRRTELKITGTDFVSAFKTEITYPEYFCLNNDAIQLLTGKGNFTITLSPFSMFMMTKSFQNTFPSLKLFSNHDIFISYQNEMGESYVLWIHSKNDQSPEIIGKKEDREIYQYSIKGNKWEKLDL